MRDEPTAPRSHVADEGRRRDRGPRRSRGPRPVISARERAGAERFEPGPAPGGSLVAPGEAAAALERRLATTFAPALRSRAAPHRRARPSSTTWPQAGRARSAAGRGPGVLAGTR